MNILFYLFCAVVTKKTGILNKYTLRSVKSDDHIDIEIFLEGASLYFSLLFRPYKQSYRVHKILKRKLYSNDSYRYLFSLL